MLNLVYQNNNNLELKLEFIFLRILNKNTKVKRSNVCNWKTKTIFHILGSWSASTSPARSPPSPRSRYSSGVHSTSHHRNNRRNHLNYGTTSLMQRSRSPSPARVQEMRERERYYRNEMGTHTLIFFIFDSTFSFIHEFFAFSFPLCHSVHMWDREKSL